MTIAPTLVLQATLGELSAATRDLRTALNRVIDDATKAVVALELGQRVAGSTNIGFGPLGTQAPFEVATLTARIDVLLNQATLQGATAEQITTAYEVV
jgi:hypothetical protein